MRGSSRGVKHEKSCGTQKALVIDLNTIAVVCLSEPVQPFYHQATKRAHNQKKKKKKKVPLAGLKCLIRAS